jgi:hypothetical protein
MGWKKLSEVLEDPHCGIMAGGADHRTCRVTSGAAGIQPSDGRGIGHALVKAEGVVDVVDMTIADAKMLLDLLGRQGEDIYHTTAESGRKLIRDTQ